MRTYRRPQNATWSHLVDTSCEFLHLAINVVLNLRKGLKAHQRRRSGSGNAGRHGDRGRARCQAGSARQVRTSSRASATSGRASVGGGVLASDVIVIVSQARRRDGNDSVLASRNRERHPRQRTHREMRTWSHLLASTMTARRGPRQGRGTSPSTNIELLAGPVLAAAYFRSGSPAGWSGSPRRVPVPVSISGVGGWVGRVRPPCSSRYRTGFRRFPLGFVS
jgi:hypothetical protein